MDARLPDPTDWAGTPLHPLSGIDALLRCQICKDFYTSAVLTSCAHTFCSLCIRRCLSADGKCPSCRAPEQESRLRRNGVLQELVDTFTTQRKTMLEAARHFSTPPETTPSAGGQSKTRISKRKRGEADVDAVHDEPPARRTRSHRASTNRSPLKSSEINGAVVIADSDDEYTPESTRSSRPAQEFDPEDGLVACPCCGHRMKEELVFSHLNTCIGKPPPPASSTNKASSFPTYIQPPESPSQTPQRLPQLSYSLLKDAALRKKLEDLKIPATGPRGLLIRRHSEWLALWNANSDSNKPRSRQELLRDLDAWERSQGGRSANGGVPGDGIKGKEFESEEYARRHNDEFTDLIAQARASRGKRAPPAAAPETDTAGTAQADEAATESREDRRANEENSRPAYSSPVENPFRRGCTAPPSTGPLKISSTLHNPATLNQHNPSPRADLTLADADADLQPLTHTASAPLPQPETSAPAVPESPQRPAISSPTKRSHAAKIAATNSAHSSSQTTQAQPGRRPSFSQARRLPDAPPPATLMWSGSSGDSRRSSIDGAGVSAPPRTVHMFQVPAEPILDSEFDMGSR